MANRIPLSLGSWVQVRGSLRGKAGPGSGRRRRFCDRVAARSGSTGPARDARAGGGGVGVLISRTAAPWPHTSFYLAEALGYPRPLL